LYYEDEKIVREQHRYKTKLKQTSHEDNKWMKLIQNVGEKARE
jgi:hypothetical protein